MSKKLDLKSTLYALDSKNREYYNNLSDEDKKQYHAFVLMRFMSSTPDQNGLHEYHVQMVNDIVNENLWDLGNHPELQHLLLTMVGVGKKQYHPWIAGPKKTNSNQVFAFLKMSHPDLNQLEFDILIKSYDVNEFKDLCKSYALEDKEIKKLVDQFKKIKEANG